MKNKEHLVGDKKCDLNYTMYEYIILHTNYLTSIWMEVDIFEMEDKQVIGPLFLIHVLKK